MIAPSTPRPTRPRLRRVALGLSLLLAAACLLPLRAAADGAAPRWTRLVGLSQFDTIDDLVADADGYLYVAGTVDGDLAGERRIGLLDAFVGKYDPDGNRLWTRVLGAADAYTYGHGIALDGAGGVYVAGTTSASLDGQPYAGYGDAFVSKFDSAGTRQWTRQIGTAGPDTAEDVVVDGAGYVSIVGLTLDPTGGQPGSLAMDAFVAQYDSSAAFQWRRQIGTARGEAAWDIAADRAGNLYIAGRTEGDLDGQVSAGRDDAFLSKLDRHGAPQWTRLIGSTGEDWATGVAVDGADNIYLVGSAGGSVAGQIFHGATDALVSKYDPNGTRQWTRLLGSSAQDSSSAVTVDQLGQVYVVGMTAGRLSGQPLSGLEDAFVSRLTGDGRLQWTRLHGSSEMDQAQAVAVDRAGRLALAGFTYGNLGGEANAGGGDGFISRIATPTLRPRLRLSNVGR